MRTQLPLVQGWLMRHVTTHLIKVIEDKDTRGSQGVAAEVMHSTQTISTVCILKSAE